VVGINGIGNPRKVISAALEEVIKARTRMRVLLLLFLIRERHSSTSFATAIDHCICLKLPASRGVSSYDGEGGQFSGVASWLLMKDSRIVFGTCFNFVNT
jgi:hypothetical protein